MPAPNAAAAPPASLHSTRFPNENPAYRTARDTPLEAEIARRRPGAWLAQLAPSVECGQLV